jgi:hypothetical protein
MKNQKWLILVVALVLMAGTACALTWLRENQKLGAPGVKTTPIPGSSLKMNINLPAQVLDFTSSNVPEPEIAVGYFPKDTSYTERFYNSPDGVKIQSTAILMGTDRTSIHRPEYCLPGQGWTIEKKQILDIPIQDNPPYSLKLARWNVSKSIQASNGKTFKIAGLYVYWYVANNEETPDHDKMLEWLTLDLFRTGALQRWAYISYFAECEPGQEDATFEDIKKLITAQVPQFEFPIKQK